ncbi:MAG: hypothetical protein AAGI69_05805 [Cyanobacteria bacterium P01_H01_bin.21]
MSEDYQGQQPIVENMSSMVDSSHGSSFEAVRQGPSAVESQGFSSQSALPYALNLHIDQLTLHGFSAVDRDRIGAAMKAELSRLLTEQGIPSQLKQGDVINQLDGGTFEITARMPPRMIGARLARAIYRGLGHG